MMAEVLHKYIPRKQFEAFHKRHQRFALMVCHRRAGKTVCVVNDMVVRAMRTQKKNAFYAYISPYFGQAKQASWTYLKDAVRNIPGSKIRESETLVILPNGARIRVFGADNADALRGLFFDGVVLDEFGDMEGRVYSEVIRPALADRQGWIVFIGTPRGKNKFFELRNIAIKNPDKWFHLELKASVSGILPESELEGMREELEEDEYQQELECSFDASVRGSYYGKQLSWLETKAGAFGDYPPVLSAPVQCAMDIGYADATAIWFWQVINGSVRFIDYWEATGYDAEETCEMLQLRPYNLSAVWLPHDAFAKTFRSKKSVQDTFRAYGLPSKRVPNPDGGASVANGIDAVRKVLRTWPITFDAVATKDGVECLKNYSRKWDVDNKVFADKPYHDQWSHGADAFRYACLSLNPNELPASIKEGRQDALKAAPPVNNGLRRATFGETLKAHDRQLARKRSQGRKNIW